MKKVVAALIAVMMFCSSCYSTYYVTMDDIEKIQSAEQGPRVVLNTDDGTKVAVESGSKLFVRDVDNKRYQITPYNFRIINQQLVASDRDYIFMMNQLKPKAEVDLLSTWKTVGLISLGVGAVTGLVVITALTAGRKSFGGN
jgi:hypothetical protein